MSNLWWRQTTLSAITATTQALSSTEAIIHYNPSNRLEVYTTASTNTVAWQSDLSGLTDTYTTGFTYSNNNLSINRNGGLSSLLVNISTMTGLTINGNLTVTGTSALNGTISSTSLTGTTDRMVQASTGGTISASRQIVEGYITNSTVIGYLTGATSWTVYGQYVGSAITGTYQAQTFVDDNYMYYAIADNNWVRLIRG